eukprot:COSAG06_NODE_42075_length_385_cov_0.622378_1_plen_68_part_10
MVLVLGAPPLGPRPPGALRGPSGGPLGALRGPSGGSPRALRGRLRRAAEGCAVERKGVGPNLYIRIIY